VPYSRTFFFQDKGRFYGIGAEIGLFKTKFTAAIVAA
jgi:hypothetical protein